MKKILPNTHYFTHIILFVLAIFLLTACKKNGSNNSSKKTPFDGKFSFTYNGTRYVLPYKEGTAEWSANRGVYIYRPDIFNGTIHFPSSGCAYFEPNGVTIGTSPGNCQLFQNGLPPPDALDSVAVYLYESGHYNITKKNCSTRSEYSALTGATIRYDVCDADGTFDLILKNKENKTIIITDGTFEIYSFRN